MQPNTSIVIGNFTLFINAIALCNYINAVQSATSIYSLKLLIKHCINWGLLEHPSSSMGEFRQHVQAMSEMEMTKQQCSEMNSTPMENLTIADSSLQTLLAHQLPEFPPILSCTVLAGGSPTATADEHVSLQTNKRKATEQSTCKSQIISPAASTTEFEGSTNTRKKNIVWCPITWFYKFQSSCQFHPFQHIWRLQRLGKGKKEKEAEEIVHVRARRGQATDSHSLAERVSIIFLALVQYQWRWVNTTIDLLFFSRLEERK